MKKVFVSLILFMFSTPAFAWHIAGQVICDFTGEPLAGVTVEISKEDGTTLTGVTDGSGNYFIDILQGVGNAASPGEWTVSIIDGTSADSTILSPGGGTYTIILTETQVEPRLLFVDDADFRVDDPSCRPEEPGLCWMTGGGVKFERVMGDYAAEKGPRDSLGGNVYPSCSPFPGNGGQWNHIAHKLKRHFQGTDIVVTRCGNVEGHPPGSESPVTPYNFIEFHGTGWVQGIHGNKIGRVPVTFQARVEDRNEPGNENASAGENIDRYWLRVDGPPNVGFEVGTQEDPATITGGNLQLHATSCD